MNPHLLFNALNTVASLVPTDPKKAEEIVIQLSELYRGVLSSSKKSTHSLDAELELCRTYLTIEKARFGERLQVSISIDPGLDPNSIDLPVLTLQPLVENAIKHGLSPKAAGGTVSIRVSRNLDQIHISVEDDGVGYGNSDKAGSGTALVNCRERLKLCFGPSAHFEIIHLGALNRKGTRATIHLPISESLRA